MTEGALRRPFFFDAIVLLATMSAVATPFWLRSVRGTAIAAAIVYAGAEAIIAHDSRRRVLVIGRLDALVGATEFAEPFTAPGAAYDAIARCP